MKEETPKELIEKLYRIRPKITAIYMKLGNPDYAEADMILRKDIIKFREKFSLD